MNGVRSTHGFLSVIVIGLLISSIISCGLTEEAVIEYQTDQYTDQDTVTNASSPRPKATAIATGSADSCALLDDKSVKCWGSSSYSWSNNNLYPSPVPEITTATAIAVGSYFSCALLDDKSVKCWGAGGSRQLGNGSTGDSVTPVTVSGVSTAKAIATGGAMRALYSIIVL